MENFLKIILIIAVFLIVSRWLWGQKTKMKIAWLKCQGNAEGNADFLSGLIRFCNQQLKTDLAKQPAAVEPGSPDIFNYPYVYMKVQESLSFTEKEVQNLREYFSGGGFLQADGEKSVICREMKKIFPEDELVEIPRNHPVFCPSISFFPGEPEEQGDDGAQLQVSGIFREGRLVMLFTDGNAAENGWEHAGLSPDPGYRQQALQIGAKMILYVGTFSK